MLQMPELTKTVRYIPPTVVDKKSVVGAYHQLRVAAYCRVSTQIEEQLNSYEVQKNYYTDKINSEPKWTLAGIYADKGISGTNALKRDEFQKMIRACKRGKIDMIITKSISRFARNTVDCLNYIRKLKEYNVDVFFEEQGIHSKDTGSEFYITIYGSIAQSESENISANVRWGKDQRAKEGKVIFNYHNFLGYRKGKNGKPEIVENEAEIIREIYNMYLSGNSLDGIAKTLTANGIKSPSNKDKWVVSTVKSILTNEKYKGDALINKTYTVDCISKKTKVNNGERPKYYVENNHPAIISAEVFNRTQEEFARRSSKRKVKQKGTKTELGKYSSKYALSELLICGECGTPYRRCTWSKNGNKKIVWRCINRLDYGKKYCKNSPSIEETVIQNAIINAIMKNISANEEVLNNLKIHIGMGLNADVMEDKSIDLQIQIARLDQRYEEILNKLTLDLQDDFEDQLSEIILEKHKLQQELERYENYKQKRENSKSRLEEIFEIIEALKNHPISYDDTIIREILECVAVESKEKIKVVFIDGFEVESEI